MSLDLAATRKAVAAAIATQDVKTRDYESESITPPCVVVIPANPYVLQPGEGRVIPFDSVLVRLDVLVLAYEDSAKGNSARIDDLIGKTLTGLRGAGYDPGDFTQPGRITLRDPGPTFVGSVTTIEIHEEL